MFVVLPFRSVLNLQLQFILIPIASYLILLFSTDIWCDSFLFFWTFLHFYLCNVQTVDVLTLRASHSLVFIFLHPPVGSGAGQGSSEWVNWFPALHTSGLLTAPVTACAMARGQSAVMWRRVCLLLKKTRSSRYVQSYFSIPCINRTHNYHGWDDILLQSWWIRSVCAVQPVTVMFLLSGHQSRDQSHDQSSVKKMFKLKCSRMEKSSEIKMNQNWSTDRMLPVGYHRLTQQVNSVG